MNIKNPDLLYKNVFSIKQCAIAVHPKTNRAVFYFGTVFRSVLEQTIQSMEHLLCIGQPKTGMSPVVGKLFYVGITPFE